MLTVGIDRTVTSLTSSIVHNALVQTAPRQIDVNDQSRDDVLPFLKWAGGKRWLLPLARQLRGLPFRRYFEPFLGSGAMFFGLAPTNAYLADSNSDLIETYLAVKQDWKAVMRKLREHHRKHSPDYYYHLRSQNAQTAHTRAAKFIYLNRTCWNGLYRVNRKGIFNVPIGTKTSVILESDALDRVAARLNDVKLKAGDFENQIDKAGNRDLIFADPPYTVRHQFNGFVKYNEMLFSWDDQERLFAALLRAKSRGAQIICTNADHASIRELYERDFHLTPVERFSAIAGAGGTRGNYAELLITG
jgi:DNA adenine methylase